MSEHHLCAYSAYQILCEMLSGKKKNDKKPVKLVCVNVCPRNEYIIQATELNVFGNFSTESSDVIHKRLLQ